MAGVRAVSVYVVNGRSLDDPMYEVKLAFLEAMAARAEQLADEPLVIAGDFNIAPADIDVYDPEAFVGATHASAAERERLEAILAAGLADGFRVVEPKTLQHSWWDYRQGHFHRGLGLRIDLALVSPDLAGRLRSAGFDRTSARARSPLTTRPCCSTSRTSAGRGRQALAKRPRDVRKLRRAAAPGVNDERRCIRGRATHEAVRGVRLRVPDRRLLPHEGGGRRGHERGRHRGAWQHPAPEGGAAPRRALDPRPGRRQAVRDRHAAPGLVPGGQRRGPGGDDPARASRRRRSIAERQRHPGADHAAAVAARGRGGPAAADARPYRGDARGARADLRLRPSGARP